MKVAFYKSRRTLFDLIVRLWTRKGYSHCELVLSEDRGVSECLSASFRDGGVRIKHITFNPEHWDIVECEGSVERARLWSAVHRHEGYDLLGLLGFVFRPLGEDRRRWFCSEAVADALGFPDSWRFDIATLHSALTRRQ